MRTIPPSRLLRRLSTTIVAPLHLLSRLLSPKKSCNVNHSSPSSPFNSKSLFSYDFVLPLMSVLLSRLFISHLSFLGLFGLSGRIVHKYFTYNLFPFYQSWVFNAVALYVLIYFAIFLFFRLTSIHSIGFYIFFYIFSLAVLILPIADVIFSLTAGQKLTPSTLQAYSSSGTGGSPFSVIFDSIYIARSYSPEITDQLTKALLKAVVVIVLCQILSSNLRKFKIFISISKVCFYLIVGISFIYLLLPSSFYLRNSHEPIHVATKIADAHFLFSSPAYPQSNYEEDVELIRDFFQLPKDQYWISNDFPLVHGDFEKFCQFNPDDSECQKEGQKDEVIDDVIPPQERPDVFFIVWECLTGTINSAVDNPLLDDATPNLKKLFKEHGVLYHELVSNACPTANSFWSIFNQALPLSHGNTIIDTLGVETDSIFDVIKRSKANYATLYTSSANPNFDGKDSWLDRSDIDDVYFKYANTEKAADYPSPLGQKFAKIWNNDRILVDHVKERTDKISKTYPNRPIFNWVTSISTHNPFTTFDDPEIVGSPWPETKAKRLFRATQYSDKYLVEKMLEYINSRNNSNTVVIIMGDHAAYKVPKLTPNCPDCPQSPFDNDLVFYTSAVLAYLGDDDQRRKLGIPKAGTRDYRAVSALDMVATIADLTGSGDEVSYSMGRSLLNSKVNDDTRKSLSLISLGAELGLPDSIVRVDWSGSTRLELMRPHPTFTHPDAITTETEWFPKIIRVNMIYNYLVKSNRLWHRDFLKDSEQFPSLTHPTPLVADKEFNIVLIYLCFLMFFCISISLCVKPSLFAFSRFKLAVLGISKTQEALEDFENVGLV
ncbi:hypothetical protein P9112_001554 [Eukaryota sp. TZLM1-RC]